MAYCPNCGEPLGDSPRGPEVEDAAVKIARMECDRDIEIARIQAGVARREVEAAETIAEIEAPADMRAAGADAELMGALIEGASQPEDQAPDAVVVEAPEGGDAEVVEDGAPPPRIEATEGSQPPEPQTKRGIGMWSSS